MGRNIWETAIGKVCESAEVRFRSWADMLGQVGGYRAFLVRRAGEVVAEASGAGGPGDLGTDGLGAADGGDVGACGWELRGELWCILAIVGCTRCTNACRVH